MAIGRTNASVGSKIELENKVVDLSMADGNQIITPSSEDKAMSKVVITRPATFIPDNILNGVNIGGVVGTYTPPAGQYSLKPYIEARRNADELFRGFNKTSLDNLISYNDTENITSIKLMFYGCYNLKSIPLFNTSNVTNMDSTFSECSNITTIPLLNTSNVKNMATMFSGCSNLITVPALDVSNVNNFNYIFNYCRNLESIEMTGMKVNFDISYSTKFTREALVVILNNLATVSTSQTLKMGATNLAKLTEEDKAIATNKGWTLA